MTSLFAAAMLIRFVTSSGLITEWEPPVEFPQVEGTTITNCSLADIRLLQSAKSCAYSNGVVVEIKPAINPAYVTWQNGVGAAWRYDTSGGNFDVALANISALLKSDAFPSFTAGQLSGLNQDAWTIAAAKSIGTEPPQFIQQ